MEKYEVHSFNPNTHVWAVVYDSVNRPHALNELWLNRRDHPLLVHSLYKVVYTKVDV